MQKKYIFLLAALFLVSRFVVINPQPIFFDSPEYLTRLQQPFITSISTGHLPLHSGYLIATWPIYHLAQFLHLEQLVLVLASQVVLGLGSLFALYGIAKRLTNEKTALWSTGIYSLLPLVWITQVSLMMEAVYLPVFIISLYCYLKYIENKKRIFLFLASLCLAEAFLTHFGIIIWVPLIYLLLAFYSKSKQILLLFSLMITIFLSSILNAYFMSLYSHAPILASMYELYFAKTGEHANIPLSLTGAAVAFRNWIIPILRNNTTTVIVTSVISALYLYKNDKKLLLLLGLWITPSLLANQWWDSLFFGRHALIASLSFAILSGIIVERFPKIRIAVLIALSLTSIPAISLLTQPIPYLEMQKIARQLPAGGLYIESHFARPQLQNTYRGRTIFVDEPGWVGNKLPDVINDYLLAQKPVFITSQALSEPYGLYSGPYLHTLSLSYKNPFDLKPLLTDYRMQEFTVITTQDNLVVYKINKNGNSPYPSVLSLKNSYRRIDYTDPFFILYQNILAFFER